MPTIEKLDPQNSLTELAHRSIKRYILEGSLDSESRLTEDFFAQQLGISKSPVREAMNTLQSEGLLRIERRRGAYLPRFTLAEVEDLYQLREALEVFVAGTAKITPKFLAELGKSVSRTRKLLDRNDRARYIEEDIHFHELIVGATGNRELRRVHANIQNKLWLCRCQTYRLTSPDTPESHRRISEALHDHDRSLAQEMTRRHIHLVRDSLVSMLRQQNA